MNRLLAVLLLILVAPASRVCGQSSQPGVNPAANPAANPAVNDASGSPPPTFDRAEIEARKAGIVAGVAADDPAIKPIVEQYDLAIERLASAALSAERTAAFARDAADAPGQLARIREELAKPSTLPDVPATDADIPLAQLEQRLAEVNAALVTARTSLAELTSEPDRRQARRTEIAVQLTENRRQFDAAQDAREAIVVRVDDRLSEARAVAAAALEQALAAEIAALQAEVTYFDARRDVLPARQDRASRRVADAERAAAAWLALVNERRKREAEAAVREAERQRRDAARQDPVLQAFAAETQALAAQRASKEGLPQKISKLDAEIVRARERLATLRTRYDGLRKRLDVSGINRATGILLRNQFDDLDDVDGIQRRVSVLARTTENAEFLQLERRDQREAYADLQEITRTILEPIATVTPDLEATARDLAAARRDLLDRLVADSADYVDRSIRAEVATRELLAATDAFRGFIGERILWVRSVSDSDMPIVEQFGTATQRLGDASDLRVLSFERILESLRPWFSTVGLLLVPVILFWARLWARRRIRVCRDLVSRFKTDAFRYTVWALVLTALASLAPSSLLWVLSLLLGRMGDQPPILGAFSAGLVAGVPLLLAIGFTRYALVSGGLLEAHFRWPARSVRMIRRTVTIVAILLVPSAVLLRAIEAIGDELVSATYGRAVFAVANITVAVFAARLLWPSGPIISDFRSRNSGSLLDRTRYLWIWTLILAPVGLVVLSVSGYAYTAVQLEARIFNTIGMVLLTVFVNGLLLRWLFITRRRVAVEDARRRREQINASADAGEPAAGLPRESLPVAIEEDRLNLPAISVQTKQLFKTGIAVALTVGFFLIWSDVLPALRTLDRVQLYPDIRVVEIDSDRDLTAIAPIGTVEQAATDPAKANGNTQQPATPAGTTVIGTIVDTSATPDKTGNAIPVGSLTMLDIVVAIVVLAAMFVLFRNLPGLVEMLVLSRLPLDAGSRFALTTILRYVIIVIGLAAASATLGITWSRVQWLVAALTFGLGFGLQEIFANFISGLIILAERPIRIADTVTVGSVSGTVTKIRMRATTITDWERKELIIPNKNFITGEVINWTLSDTLLRVTIPVGVSYDSDTREAERVLLRVADESELVIKEPKAYVLFAGFGDSTLNLELRLFISHVDQVILVRNAMHHSITAEFRKAGIEIAYPQRDLHIRSADPIKAVLSEEIERRRSAGDRDLSP